MFENWHVFFSRSYIAETLLAVEYLHSYGIIHYDVKPDKWVTVLWFFRHMLIIFSGSSSAVGVNNLYKSVEIILGSPIQKHFYTTHTNHVITFYLFLVGIFCFVVVVVVVLKNSQVLILLNYVQATNCFTSFIKINVSEICANFHTGHQLKFNNTLIPEFCFYVQNNFKYGLNHIVLFIYLIFFTCDTSRNVHTHTYDVACVHYNSMLHAPDVGRLHL